TEQYESVLVKVTNATCDTTKNQYGEWWVNDGSGPLLAKDNGAFSFTPILNTVYNITGVMAYSYSKFSIQYRRESDITIVNNIESEFANAVSIYPNPASETINIVTDNAQTITITNLVGQIVKEISVANEIETIDVSSLNAGVYFVQLAKANETAVVKIIVE
ncbi:MAG: T9SS type A sorting domain-containing protein, partial [Bacteroidales bacterium]|nr:T9SS type A sorting domain-containing protein [Bacteroidales bacterium]